ncbi:Protein of unknown function [Lactobacillus equicursoris DSM 19284 = JCM 14600 = CIP 110162]|nr:Protein of unknown function [Lactobacillus equicursoris DSM 19284 = JCM 14600 = CIP 110162]
MGTTIDNWRKVELLIFKMLYVLFFVLGYNVEKTKDED